MSSTSAVPTDSRRYSGPFGNSAPTDLSGPSGPFPSLPSEALRPPRSGSGSVRPSGRPQATTATATEPSPAPLGRPAERIVRPDPNPAAFSAPALHPKSLIALALPLLRPPGPAPSPAPPSVRCPAASPSCAPAPSAPEPCPPVLSAPRPVPPLRRGPHAVVRPAALCCCRSRSSCR
jgi:hypothetical protein